MKLGTTGKFSAFAAILAIALTFTPGIGIAAAGGPMATVKSTVDRAMPILRDHQTPLAQRQDALRKIIAANFDFKEMSKSALGRHWWEITPAQQGEFTKTFVAFIEDAYLSKINDFRAQNVTFLRMTRDSDDPNFAQVYTTVTQPDAEPIGINYRLLKEPNGAWRIYDVAVDAISIILNYRNQFNRVMNNQGYGVLINDLKSKQAALATSLVNH
ncbi:MAG: MlaC/ttg2D family ABC transporter substrate-binding protein [Candidatus Binataceae bacterium]